MSPETAALPDGRRVPELDCEGQPAARDGYRHAGWPQTLSLRQERFAAKRRPCQRLGGRQCRRRQRARSQIPGTLLIRVGAPLCLYAAARSS